MTLAVTHALVAVTPDDPAYEIRPSHWNAGHSLVGTADFSQGGTNNNATPAAGTLAWSDGSKLTSDANLTWSATTGLLTKKGMSSQPNGTSIGSEVYGAGSSDASNQTPSNNVIVGSNNTLTASFGTFDTLVGSSLSSSHSFCAFVGTNITSTSDGICALGSFITMNSGSTGGICGIGSGLFQGHSAGGLIGVGGNSRRPLEMAMGWASNPVNDFSFRLYGSTGSFVDRDLFRISNTWIDSTDATRKVRTIFNTYDTAEREFMRADANGSGADLYLNGNTSPLSAAAFSLGTAALPWQQLFVDFTNTATVGSVTINKASGTVNMAALGSTLTVTNSLVTANSRIIPALSSDPGVALSIWCVGGAGSFTVNTRPAVVNQTAIDFIVFP